jgi:hypothetical protein
VKEVQFSNNKGNLITCYEAEDIAFVNTSLFNETARHYTKHGCYTFAPEGTIEHTSFWDREEERILNGMTAPGKLMPDGSIQQVRITGLHYAYLNYGRIKLTNDKNEVLLGKGDENFLKSRVREKEVAFPDFWDGDYHFFKAKEFARQLGKHLVVAKARRKGYSYKNGMVGAYAATFIPYSTTILGAYDKKYLTQGDAITTMVKNYLDWFQLETDFNRGWLKETIDDLRLGYYKSGNRTPHGYKSKILSLTFQDNPDAAIGKDANEIVFEEAGNFPNLFDCLDVTIPTMEDGDYVTGQITVFGTGGSREGNYVAFEKLFYEPEAYGFLPFHNVWDDEAKGTTCGLFHPHTLNLKPFIDKDGNSDVDSALESTIKRREKKKENTTNIKVYNRYCAQRAIKPSEAFSGTEVSIFDSPELREHIAIIEHNPVYSNIRRDGILEEINGEIKFISNHNLPLNEVHPYLEGVVTADTDMHGCYAEWYTPYRDENGRIPDNLYRVWNDPYAFEKEAGEIKISDSLGSAFVYERPNNFTPTKGDRIVACLIGRPPNPDDYNYQLLQMTRRWNAVCQFESDRGDVRNYFKHAGEYDLLADSPDFDWSRELKGSTTTQKGIRIGQGSDRKGNAAIMLKQWLYTKVGINEDTGKIIYNFHYIYDLGLLKELTKWNLKGNFDRVSAMLIGMLDKNEITHVDINRETTKARNSFFDRMDSFFQ